MSESWRSSPLLQAIAELEFKRIQAAKPATVDRPDQSLVEKYDWDKHAREKQRIPAGEWRFWLVCAGRYFGKTRTGAETVRKWAQSKPGSVGALIGQKPEEVRGTMVEGRLSGLLDCSPPWFRPKWEPSKGPAGA